MDFDDLFKIYGLVSPKYVKIDVDGNELEILENLLSTKNQIKSILVEMNYKKNDLENILVNNRFQNVFRSDRRNNQIWENLESFKLMI